MKQMNRRFEVIYTQDDTVTCFHVLLDKETQCKYLWIESEQGMALTGLKTINAENCDEQK